MSEEALHHTIVFYDVQGSAQLVNPEKIAVREAMHDCCVAAVTEAGIPAEHVTEKDLGDGAMLLFTAQVPKSLVLGPWLSAFHRRWQRDYERAARPVQVRLAVHSGELHRSLDEHTGAALDFSARLVDAPIAKRVLASAPSASLAVLVSDTVYDQVVRHGGGPAPASFTRIGLKVKETDAWAWLHLPGWARVPMPKDADADADSGADIGSNGTGPGTGTAAGNGGTGGDHISVTGGTVGVIGDPTVNGGMHFGAAPSSPDGSR